MTVAGVVPSGEKVGLRPVVESDLAVFEQEASSPEATGPLQWFGFRPVNAMRQQLRADGLIGPEQVVLTVTVDGECAGRVTMTQALWGRRDTSWCWSLGFGLHAPYRGRGIGTVAQRMVVEYLFAHTRVERVQAVTDVTNVAEQRALEKAGFTREGVVRRGQFRGGTWHDQTLYSVLRSEVPLDLP